ncbi:hypothetical protein, partial [Pseudomonas brenneri]
WVLDMAKATVKRDVDQKRLARCWPSWKLRPRQGVQAMKWHWRYLALIWLLWWAWTQQLGFSTPLTGWIKLGVMGAALWFGLGFVKTLLDKFLPHIGNDPKVVRGVELATSASLLHALELTARGIRTRMNAETSPRNGARPKTTCAATRPSTTTNTSLTGG